MLDGADLFDRFEPGVVENLVTDGVLDVDCRCERTLVVLDRDLDVVLSRVGDDVLLELVDLSSREAEERDHFRRSDIQGGEKLQDIGRSSDALDHTNQIWVVGRFD